MYRASNATIENIGTSTETQFLGFSFLFLNYKFLSDILQEIKLPFNIFSKLYKAPDP